jgi:pyruvate dehydrogenase E1 component alpha subunit
VAKAASPKRASAGASANRDAPPQTPNRERPEQPGRYEASREELLEFYRQMLLIRRFEERAGQLYGLGLIGGFCHLYIGQEAVAVGLQSAMNRAMTASSPATATTATCSPTASIRA